MGKSKKDAREQRKLAKIEKKQAKSIQLANSMREHVKQPRILDAPPLSRTPRSPGGVSKSQKSPRSTDPRKELLDVLMTWCDTQADIEGEWGWGEQRAWSQEEYDSDVKPSLDSMGQNTWGNIWNDQKVKAKKGKEVPKHHDHPINNLCKEAQDRWVEHGLEEHDTAFRFRFGSTKRAWGVRLQAHFYLVWWERHHQIYPVD